MKKKTIKAVIRKKIGEWLATIEDEALRDQLSKNVIVTGGCIASMLLREKVNDFDIYFRNKATALATAEYYVKRFKPRIVKGVTANISVREIKDRIKIVVQSAGISSEAGTKKPYQYFEATSDDSAGDYVAEIMDNPGDIEDTYVDTQEKSQEVKADYRPVFLSTNAITLSDRIQLVHRFFGEPEDIHKNYDFIHCTNYWTSWDGKLELNQPALESLLAKELIYTGSLYPVCSVMRLRKFIKRQWTVNAGQILKMALQISALNLNDIEVLEDQLTGVDCAYFCELIAKVKEKDPEKVNSAYLVEIIDRMF